MTFVTLGGSRKRKVHVAANIAGDKGPLLLYGYSICGIRAIWDALVPGPATCIECAFKQGRQSQEGRKV